MASCRKFWERQKRSSPFAHTSKWTGADRMARRHAMRTSSAAPAAIASWMLKITAKAGSGGETRCSAPLALATSSCGVSTAKTVWNAKCRGGAIGFRLKV
eukprot:8671027-Lingulodinium_polyedra.AAC.1